MDTLNGGVLAYYSPKWIMTGLRFLLLKNNSIEVYRCQYVVLCESHHSSSLGTELTCHHFVPGQNLNIQGITQVV